MRTRKAQKIRSSTPLHRNLCSRRRRLESRHDVRTQVEDSKDQDDPSDLADMKRNTPNPCSTRMQIDTRLSRSYSNELHLEIEAIRSHGRVWKYKGVAKVDGKRMADAEWSATIVDRKK